MLPTNCCDFCECCSKATRPLDKIRWRNKKIDRIVEENPEKAAVMSRYGWAGFISAVFCVVFQAVCFYLTAYFINIGVENDSATLKGLFSLLGAYSLAIVPFVCSISLALGGCWTGVSYGRSQKRLNALKIGTISIIFGILNLIVMVAGIAILYFAFF